MSILRFPERLIRDKAGLPCLLIFLAAFLFAAQAIAIEIPLQKQGGVYILPVRINGVITLSFILDSGASEVTIPADVALTLLRAGTISEKDFLPGEKYRLADGSILKGARFRIRELEVGGYRITNVPAVVAPVTGSLLLGQSFLSRASHWAIDNERQLLVISEPMGTKATIARNATVPRLVPIPKSDVIFSNGPGIPGLEWGDSPAQVAEMMSKNNAVYLMDVCEGSRVINKETRKHWEYYDTSLLKTLCESNIKLNEEAKKHGQYFMNFAGTFMDRDVEVILILYERKLYKATIMFFESKPGGIVYSDLLKKLKLKYGPAYNTFEDKSGKNEWRNAMWSGSVTNIFLREFKPTVGISMFTYLDYSDWKTEKIADELERQYNREVGLGYNKSDSGKTPAPQSTPQSKSVIPPLPDLPIKHAVLVKAMLDGAKNAEVEKIDHSKAELQALSKSQKCRSQEAHKKNAAGIEATSKEDYDDALKHFYEAYLHCPKDVEILNNLGSALTRTGDYDNAEKALLRALSLAPTRTNAWFNLASVLSIKGDVTDGCACFLNGFRYTRSERKTTEVLQNYADNDPFPNTQEAARLALTKLRNKRTVTLAAEPIPGQTRGSNLSGPLTGQVNGAGRTLADVEGDLIRAAKTAVAVYKQNGMAGLIGETNECYDKGKENGFYCVYLDLASRHIDQIMVAGAAHSGMTFPKTEFFDDELFGARIVTVFRKANMNMDKSNEYLRTLTPAINKLVEDNF